MKLHCFILLGCIALATSCQTQRPSRAGSLLLRPGAEAWNTPAPDRFLVRLETTRGDLIVDVHREWSPHGVDRFYHLARAGYYDQAAFFRVIAGKWAQFGINGDPQIARLWREQRIPDDPRILSNTRGTLAFAFAVPNGRTTQLFINLRDNSATHDAAPFVPFGKIVAGMDVADALNSEYGESAGGGIRGGQQDPLFTGGNDYLKRNFPRLDYLKRATIVPSSAILFGGVPIRLRLSRAGDKTVRIGLAPADGGRQSDSPFLAKFSSRQVLELSELRGVKEVHVGKLRVELQPHPLTVSIRRADDTLVQRFVFPEDAGTNGINFRTASPVFGLGEGGDQFDRRG
ncbi:MAG TPA: peptidylprolyl isomerase, partial [Verrucomicrobiae bacterium]|nr:peptidylprolyl isomerase [Verrucomicrobiae bacterium]